MKKNKLFLFTLLMIFVLCLVACGKKEAPKYSVTFVTNNGTILEPIYVANAGDIEFPSLTKEGYKLVDWFTDSEYKNEYKDDFLLEGDTIFYAKWEILKFKVKFMNGNELVEEQEVEYGSDAIAPTNPEKDGYDFDKWDKAFTEIKEDLVVNAEFKLKQFEVKFMDGTKQISSVIVEYGKAATAPTNTDKTGYTFIEWDKEFDEIKSDLVVNAVYEAIEYNISYYDGTTALNLAPAKLAYGESFTLPTYAVDGYVFVGWYKDDKFNVPFTDEDTVNGDLSLKALLVKIDYNGGSASWSNESWGENDPAKGIDPISDLPEYFEKDFYKYLCDEELLNSTAVGATVRADSWEVFSGVNPMHSGDPKRIWNDCTQNKANDSSDGYMALYLFGSLEVDESGKLLDIVGGFLGNEPYKTKYFNVMQHLINLYNGKYSYDTVDPYGDNNSARQLYAFLLDGWFYGTQGLKKDNGQFDSARKMLPTTIRSYTWSGTALTPKDNVYAITTDNSEIQKVFAVPFGVTEFDGWYLDAEGNTKLTEENITNRMTIYAKWK